MTLTAAAQWLNTAFAGYDKAILKIMHSLAGALGPVLTPLMKLITFLGEKGLLLLLLSLVLMCFARTRRIGVCVFGAVCCGALITNFILKDWIARPRPFETVDLYRQWWQAVGSPAEDGYSFPSGHVTAAIGKDTLIDTNGIIAILNIETLEKKENLENVCKNINISDKIIDVSEKNKKSLIITVEKNETRGYISNISTSTLERRTNKIGGIK